MPLPAMAPSASTRSMSSDRGTIGKLLGHLFIAAKTLIEGQVCSMQEMRHEMRTILQTGGKNVDTDMAESLDNASSVLAWNKLVRRDVVEARKLPDNSTVPDNIKKDLARTIRQGKKLCGGGGLAATEARKQIKKASELYFELSGVSYL